MLSVNNDIESRVRTLEIESNNLKNEVVELKNIINLYDKIMGQFKLNQKNLEYNLENESPIDNCDDCMNEFNEDNCY